MSTRSMSIRTVFLALLVTLTMCVQGARAQSSGTLAKATVPFAFQYAQHSFAAGTYRIGMVSDHIMIVRGQNNVAMGVVLLGTEEQQRGGGRLVFQRSRDGYVLRDVWVPSLSAHLICPKAKQHRQRELVEAQQPVSPEVEVALLEMPR